jgi:hypothetical protein
MNIARLVAGVTAALMTTNAAGPSVAATALCLQPADIEAEQAIRYQTDLMVISDTCGSGSYRDFTIHNRETIIFYQNQLIDRFRRAGVRNPRASLDSYLTEMANQSSLATVREATQAVCGRSAALLAEASTLKSEQFRHRMATLAAENVKGNRRCSG